MKEIGSWNALKVIKQHSPSSNLLPLSSESQINSERWNCKNASSQHFNPPSVMQHKRVYLLHSTIQT
jgi:hypothetical protein